MLQGTDGCLPDVAGLAVPPTASTTVSTMSPEILMKKNLLFVVGHSRVEVGTHVVLALAVLRYLTEKLCHTGNMGIDSEDR